MRHGLGIAPENPDRRRAAMAMGDKTSIAAIEYMFW
jgi:hypothetical protein